MFFEFLLFNHINLLIIKYLNKYYMSKKKICTACDLNSKGVSKIIKTAKWIKVSKLTNDPPQTYIPNPKEIISAKIDMPQFANRLVYYFASESKSMLKKDNKYHKKISPDESYDDYENRGVTKLNSKGKGTIYFSNPVPYYVKEDSKSYPPHVHFKISNKNNTGWLKTIYTIDF